MTDTTRRLEELDRRGFDTDLAGRMEDEIGDYYRYDEPRPEPPITPDDMEFLRSKVFDEPWTDPARFPECMQIAWDALDQIARAIDGTAFPADEARKALRLMARRADFGGPLDEPMEGP